MNHRQMIIYALLVCVGCGRAPDLLQKYGWRESSKNRNEVDHAVGLCNKILAPKLNHLKLRTAWSDEKEGIPVYLVGLANLTWSDMLFVPEDERAVIIGQPQLEVFCARYVKRVEDRPLLLALFLLHELGHIHHGEDGSYTGSDSRGLNLDLTDQKRKEEAADEFAVGQIREGMKVGQPTERFVASCTVGNSLGMLSFNVNTSALLKDFGGRSRSRYWDAGYTHPNFERRLLVMEHLLAPTTASAALLEQFDEERSKAGTSPFFHHEPTLRLIQDPEKN